MEARLAGDGGGVLPAAKGALKGTEPVVAGGAAPQEAEDLRGCTDALMPST